MDLVTRKKLLLRKYNNKVFSQEQYEFFGKINATEVIILLKENPHLRQCSLFFQHVSIREIQKLIASIFQPEETFIRSQIFNILINILRVNTMLLQICFKNDDFNYMSIFGFLDQQHIDYPILILLEDVLLPYIRKTPFQIMDIIANDNQIQDLLLKRIYQKPIFKIMYTVIFCLSKRHSQIYKDTIKKIIHQIVQTPFTYLSHKQKKSIEKISIIALNKTQLKNENKSKSSKDSKDVPAIHTKKIKQKKKTGSSINSEELKNNQQIKIMKKLSLSQKKKRQRQESEKSLSSTPSSIKKGQHQLSLQIDEITQLRHEQGHSMSQIQEPKQIPLNEDLDYGDLTFNMKDLLSDISFNIRSVDINSIMVLLQNFNQEYIKNLLNNCHRYITNDQYEGYCQGIIYILIQFGQLYKAVIKHSNNIKNSNPANLFNTPIEYQISINNLITKLQKQLQIIANKLPYLCQFLLQNNQIYSHYSTGERLKKISLTKYKILKLIQQILELNNKQNYQICNKLNLIINFNQFDFFLVAQKYLTVSKWNNLIHTKLISIIKLILEQDYPNFKKRYIQHIDKPKDGILGTLMEQLRNKKYVFLKNMKFTNYGNLYGVYSISKLIVQNVQKHNDYQLLISKFPVFDIYVHKDLIQFQSHCLQSSQVYDKNMANDVLNQILRTTLCGQDMNNPNNQLNGTLQQDRIRSSEQLLHELQNSKRWIPSPWPNITRKSSI